MTGKEAASRQQRRQRGAGKATAHLPNELAPGPATWKSGVSRHTGIR